MSYTYGDASHKHAATALSNGNTYGYDVNGNMTSRTISGQNYTLGCDAENRLVTVSGVLSASFVYNGEGRFAQADSVVPDSQNLLDYDRYSYVRNNPLRYADPSGPASRDIEKDTNEH